jgi:hypothetical protein
MTEQEWLESENGDSLLVGMQQQKASLRRKAGQRRLHLFNCACLRGVWEQLTDPFLQETVALIERLADGKGSRVEVDAAERTLRPTLGQAPLYLRAAVHTATTAPMTASRARNVAWGVATANHTNRLAVESAHADLLREIFGNLFRARPARKFPPEVKSLARACYDGETGAYSILADALADLGEEPAAEHCRQTGHVKGCHVVDAILGKS